MSLWSKRSMTRIKGSAVDPYNRVSPVRFHPGHYWNPKYGDQDNGAVDGGGNISAASWATLLTTIDIPAIRGLTWREDWLNLEPTEGVYSGIDILEQRCEELAAIGKRFIVHIPTRTFTSTDHIAPTWARNATYDGGEHAYTTSSTTPTINGYNLNWYDAAVQAKLLLLADELATRMAAHSNFEGVILMENASGIRVTGGVEDPLTAGQVTDMYAGHLAFISQIKITRPDLLAVHYTNVRSKNTTIIPDLVAANVGIGSPDLFMQPQANVSPAWAENDVMWTTPDPKGFYRYCHDYEDQVPIVIHVQPDNYRWPTKADRGNYVPTIQQLIDAVTTADPPNLFPNYVIWTSDSGGDANLTTGSGVYPNFKTQVLAKLAEAPQLVNPAGGLNANYPTDY